ncbi:AAA family ATPase [Desulfovibrio intestinalis]|uniref:Uncharacterized protein YhaN n=1 Tax=Desulfovibrio intestinalis TaxID=58621 RepID=A0A7W8FF65_9BACT|nr:AAA family ATPase [Desulfovibrio intestinalis]MBB5142475.1 uncharacterized protein YhaN [Desulfovibrio intestinalis]
MYIQSFHMDGFGIFSDVTVEGLGPGLSIFLGENEAGKSTCLEFLRSTLAGYPAPNSKEGKLIPGALRGGSAGGSLTLYTGEDSLMRLTRRPGGGANGQVSLTDNQGKPLDEDVLRRLLSGVSRDVYRNVFGFSLTELEHMGNLTGESVRHALYGASFGPGLRAPGEVLNILKKQNDEIFKSGGSKPPLNQALKQLNDLRQRMAELRQQQAGFDELARELDEKREELVAARGYKAQLEEERRLLERRLGVWLQWNEWRMVCAALERLGPVNETFPEDGQARLARAQEAREICERHLAARTEKLNLMRERRDAVQLDLPLLDALPALRRMAERKSGFRQASTALPAQKDRCRRAEEDLARELARLGPDWSCDRIRQTDRSLFAREDLEKQAREMTASVSAHQAAVDTLNQCNREVETAERDVASFQKDLAVLPTPVAALDDDQRDTLRQALTRQEEARRQIPLRQRAVQEARTTFARALTPLRLSGVGATDASDTAVATLDALLTRQDEALELAASVQERLEHASEAALAVQQAEEQMASVKGRMDALREEQRGKNGPTREDLDGRTAALRSLRALSSSLGTERQRLDEVDARLENEPPVKSVKNLPLLILGLIFFVAGVGMLLTYWRLGLTTISLAEGMDLPVNLWSGYLILLCGVGFLAGGLPHNGPEAKRRKKELTNLQNRRETCANHVAELEEQARQLCQTAHVQSMDMVTLEATEVLLEREREQCFHEERARKDMEGLKRATDLARTEVSRRQALCQEVEGVVQQTRRRWHEFMLTLKVGNVPAPEGAAAFFARAESARLAFSGVAAAQAELKSLEDDLARTEERMRQVAAVAERLPTVTDTASSLQTEESLSDILAETARQILESCREADAAREQRIKAEAALQNAENDRQRSRTRQNEATNELRAAEERLNTARSQWAHCLEGLGLGTDLDPETVREAFKYMENCLAAESALERAHLEQAQSLAELAALRDPLSQLLVSLNRSPVIDSNEEPDWLASLDATLEAAEDMAIAQTRRHGLDQELAELVSEARAAEAALDSAAHAERSLLALASAVDSEDFLRQAARHEEQRNLAHRKVDLEDALRLAADKCPLEEFLAQFETESQETQEKRCTNIKDELAQLQDREQELGDRVSTLRSGVEALSHNDELAQLQQEAATLEESMQRMAFDWSRKALARAILEAAKNNFERERQPEVIRLASEIFARITGRRWLGISASLEDKTLSILPAQGEALAPENLSRGAREQAYLALRLAYIKNHAAHALPLPIIMDEVLVNFDPQRAERTARAFVDLTDAGSSNGHQLLYFTCQPHMVELLRKAEPTAALFHVEQGQIWAA